LKIDPTAGVAANAIFSVTDTTDATSTTASLKTAGGLAVAKKAYFGDAITATATIPLALRRDLQISAADQSFGLTSYSAKYDASNYGIGAYISAVSGSAWSVTNYQSDLSFQVTPSASTTSAEAMRLSSTALTLAAGVNLVMASGKGIDFSATSEATGMTNEVLSDYEEGTYTATLTCSTSGTITLNAAADTLHYTKIGRQVTVTGLVAVASVSSPVGNILVSIPFTSGVGVDAPFMSSPKLTVYDTVAAQISQFVGLVLESENYFRIYLGDNTALQNDSAQEIQAGTSVAICLTYFV
jgi:hypothetical protein